jgi:hypothetical protein
MTRMTRTICNTLALTIALLTSTSARAGDSYETRYDRFTDISGTTSKTELRGKDKTLFVMSVVHKGKEYVEGAPIHHVLEFWSFRETWAYLHCHSFAMLVDGKPVRLPPSKHDGRVSRGFVSEFLVVKTDASVFATIASAKTVEIQVCNDEWRLPQKAIDHARRMVAITTPPPAKVEVETPPVERVIHDPDATDGANHDR